MDNEHKPDMAKRHWPFSLARDVNVLDLRFLLLLLRNSYSKHSILHTGLNLIHLRILWQPELAEELPDAPLDTVPLVILVLLLFASLSTNLENSAFFHLYFHFFFLKSRKVSFENMSFWGLLPINPCVDKCGGFTCRGEDTIKGIPYV